MILFLKNWQRKGIGKRSKFLFILIEQNNKLSRIIKIMKKQLPQDLNGNVINQSCPPKIQQDVTRSITQQEFRAARSQQFKPSIHDQPSEFQQRKDKQPKKETEHKLGVHEKSFSEHKIEIKIVHKKGTEFDCEKVESVEMSCEEESYRSGSLKSKGNHKSQNDEEEPKSAKKPRKDKQKQNEPEPSYRRQEIKQDSLNVLVTGAEDIGKTTFIRCFKKKQRKNDEPHIRPRTRQIQYELGIADQNLANRRNTVYFVDLPGFSQNNEDKYLSQIKQYALIQWEHYKRRPEDDRRIHCCLYFLRGPRIKDSDIKVMKSLSVMFNLIPVIAKSDQYTLNQIIEIKEQFQRKVFEAGQINFYDLEEFYRLTRGTQRINQAMVSKFGRFPPFVIASSFQKQSPQCGGFVRRYTWGKVEIENEEHTDFEKLCEILSRDIRSQLLNKMPPLVEEEAQVVEELVGVVEQQNLQQRIEPSWRGLLKDNMVGVSAAIGLFAYMIWQLKKK